MKSASPFRMTEQAYLVLLALTPEPLHGYAVIQAVRKLSGGRTALAAATLYGNLDRLLHAGLVATAAGAGRPRSACAATSTGGRRPRAGRRPRVTGRGGSPFERSARFWMTAYPRRWRGAHGEELLGVLDDVARRGDGTVPRRLARAEVVGLLRAGWALRWREHPPFWRWLAYRFLDARLPERYWWWVADDIRSPWFPLIQTLWALGPLLAVFTVARLTGAFVGGSFHPTFWIVYVGGIAGGLFLMRGYRRRRAWTKHIVKGHVPEVVRRPAP